MPYGSSQTVNSSAAARALRERLYARLRRYVDGLQFGEPVRASEVVWTIMNEPGVADVREMRLRRYPPDLSTMNFDQAVAAGSFQTMGCGENVTLQANQIPVFVDLDEPVSLAIV
jgi:hypothetical protein